MPHSEQVVEAVVAKLPAEQVEHAEAPLPPWNVPAAQLVHSEAPDPEYFPAAQFTQTIELEIDINPAAHETQLELPMLEEYEPATQARQLLAPTAE